MIHRRLILGAALTAPALRSATAQEATLRAVSAFQEGTAFARPFETFIARVNEEGRGKIRINFIGGPRAMPPFEVGNALRNGVIDMANSTAAFYENLMPEGAATKLATKDWAEVRANGGFALLARLHAEKVNAHYLGRHGDKMPFHLYLTREIGAPDLRGLTIRTSPVYRAFFTALGANLVNTAPGEVFTALERGVVQGYGWPAQGIFDLGWHERTRFRVDPSFYRVEVNVLVNNARWARLNDEQRAILTRAAEEMEAGEAERSRTAIEADYARMREANIRVIEFTGENRDRWLKVAQDAGWDELARNAPQHAAELRRLLSGT
ncbi:TRAP transporter substrate-binding protein DctP [Roseomonas sp. CCTCC AB2023176]|uniref:TRAP transporter substrate-binding protein DctP n=1 Tax=Roseomonas sp. CCTCC AB2023176 TaxID=3342640 RepID=UPI0035DD9BB6